MYLLGIVGNTMRYNTQSLKYVPKSSRKLKYVPISSKPVNFIGNNMFKKKKKKRTRAGECLWLRRLKKILRWWTVKDWQNRKFISE